MSQRSLIVFGLLALGLAGCSALPLGVSQALGSLMPQRDATPPPSVDTRPSVPDPLAVPTTMPGPPTPSPYSGPLTALVGWGFPLDQDATLPKGPTPDSTPTTWELAPNQADKATLQGYTLHALKPGGILLVGHAGDRVAYLFMAAYQPGISSEAVPPNTPWGNFNLNGVRIINSSAEWDSFYKSLFAAPATSSNTTMSPPPPPSTPPIDFSQHSLLLYRSTTEPTDGSVYVASVTSDTVDIVIPNATGEGWPPAPVPNGVSLTRLIPKVSASATVTIERMPQEVFQSARPTSQSSGVSP